MNREETSNILETDRGMNILVYKLVTQPLNNYPYKGERLLKIEDNIGESIHIHWHVIRFELTVLDFLALCGELEKIKRGFIDGDS